MLKDEYGYMLHSGPDGSCYFCGKSRTHTFRTPPLNTNESEIQTIIEHRAYNVCPKCLARCIRKGNDMTHDQLVEYVQFLEARGSVRGRVKITDVEAKLSIPVSNTLKIKEALSNHFTFETHQGPLTVLNIIVSDGKINVVLG